ncbi:glycoside hydrolase family 16 protein [Gelatoporia subvermispora B]|uniref:Glycoside hydrolase family 16 protein n=1 Tax=Ceriporiopsis subvermispora (strain B) TaxID=914234 RepID=M2RFW4_CERS8|nr:glycoside hydrolase family 16 protein [Gelatoporia subvermispora B]
MRTGLALVSLGFVLIRLASGHYILADSYIGQDFFNDWTWQTMDDPTHGRVNYVDKGTAMASNLSYSTGPTFVMRADNTNIVGPNDRGRNSVRIISNKAYAESVVVLDLLHMPTGCTTWPAFWTLSEQGPWPQGGEIDIVEGVNLNTVNLASLHTTPGCSTAQERFQTGTTVSTNCDASVNFNQGCGVNFQKPASYGAPFNTMGGGYFVMSRDATNGIQIWYWPRNDKNVPEEVRNPDTPGLTSAPIIAPDPSWGPPEATFPTSDTCDYNSHFDAHQMIFDLTFCGDFAGNAYATSGCGGTCEDLVDNQPEAFSNAYWEINSLRVYTPM